MSLFIWTDSCSLKQYNFTLLKCRLCRCCLMPCACLINVLIWSRKYTVSISLVIWRLHTIYCFHTYVFFFAEHISLLLSLMARCWGEWTGTKNGQTRIVREGTSGVAYSWNLNEYKWEKVFCWCFSSSLFIYVFIYYLLFLCSTWVHIICILHL